MRIVISEFMDEAAVSRLAAQHDTLYDKGLVDRPDALRAALAGADALIVRNRTQVNRDLLAAAPSLKVVGRLGVGLDNIDVDACGERGIEVIPATGANALAVAEYVIGAAMLLLRGAYASSAAVAEGQWPRGALSNGRELAGKTLGIVGFGGIGRLAGRLGRALGMRVIGFDAQIAPYSKIWSDEATAAYGLDALLAEADVVTLHVPLVEATRHLIDATRLAQMKEGAILINTARGGVVDESAVAAALKTGRLGGAALDVFEQEPLAAGSPLAGCPNLLLTPHIAGVTAESNTRVSGLIAEKVAAALSRVTGSTADVCMTGEPHAPRHARSLRELASRALSRAGANDAMADATARALVYADAQGLASHGVSRVPQYATHLENGRADGAAEPRVVREKGGAVLIDARCGLAFQACALAVDEAIRRAREFGVAFVGVTNSHHFGAAAYHLEPVGAAGLVGLAMGNSPAAMAAAGGRRPLFGTNPIAAVFPRRDAPPLVIDLSLSEVARGKLMVAAKEGRAIPLGWALDADGHPTTDPKAGLEGSMLPMGGTKGAMLALVVELFVTALTGAAMGFEASSFFVDEGNRPRLGQAFLVVDPDALAGRETFLDRIEVLIAEMTSEPGVRLPGARRRALAEGAAARGVEIPAALLLELERLAGKAPR